MSLAFEITEDDVSTVLEKHGISVSDKILSEIFETVVMPAAQEIEDAALNAEISDDDEETLMAQTEAAHAELARILEEEKVFMKHA